MWHPLLNLIEHFIFKKTFSRKRLFWQCQSLNFRFKLPYHLLVWWVLHRRSNSTHSSDINKIGEIVFFIDTWWGYCLFLSEAFFQYRFSRDLVFNNRNLLRVILKVTRTILLVKLVVPILLLMLLVTLIGMILRFLITICDKMIEFRFFN